MATKIENTHTDKGQATPTLRRALNSTEFAQVKARVLEPGRTPSPAAKQAIANYKRMKAERVK